MGNKRVHTFLTSAVFLCASYDSQNIHYFSVHQYRIELYNWGTVYSLWSINWILNISSICFSLQKVKDILLYERTSLKNKEAFVLIYVVFPWVIVVRVCLLSQSINTIKEFGELKNLFSYWIHFHSYMSTMIIILAYYY